MENLTFQRGVASWKRERLNGFSSKTFKVLTKIPILGIFDKKTYTMAKNTSILLGEHFENFVNEKVSSGKFASVSEVIRTALRLLEQEEKRHKSLVRELEIGEDSGFIKDFDRKENLKKLHSKYIEE